MEFKNIDNWKTVMKRVAEKKSLDIQDVQQRYILEEFAQKISASQYRNQLILKGGFVVSTLLGLDTRMTRDLDLTCRTSIYKENQIIGIIQDIIDTPTNSFFEYSIDSIRLAQNDDHYSGYVVMLSAKQGKSLLKFKLDISNNTLIYPDALMSTLNSMFGEETISLHTYSLENIIAEKYETTLDRGEFNGRMRDIVDIYLLMKNNSFMIDNNVLAETIIEVSKDRNTLNNLDDFDEIIESLRNSQIFKDNYIRYRDTQYPEMKLSLDEVIDQFKVINQMIIDFKNNSRD